MPDPAPNPPTWEEARRREREVAERDRIERGMEGRLARAREIPKHPFIPLTSFTPAALELRQQFCDGNWYGCIVLAIALADGIGKHVAAKGALRARGSGAMLSADFGS